MHNNNNGSAERNLYYVEGVEAFDCGHSNNPYPKHEKSHNYWQEGYDYAELCQTSFCTKIIFENKGQEFTEWYVNYRNIVLDSHPGGKQWIGSRLNRSPQAGSLLTVKTTTNEIMTIAAPVSEVIPLSDTEYGQIRQSYQKWLNITDNNTLNVKAKLSGTLIAVIQENNKLLCLSRLEKGSTQYACLVLNQHDQSLCVDLCHSKEDIVQFFGFTDTALKLYAVSQLFSELELEDIVELYRDGNKFSI